MHNIFDIPATTQGFRTFSLRRGTGRAQHHTIKDTTQSFRIVSLRRGTGRRLREREGVLVRLGRQMFTRTRKKECLQVYRDKPQQ